METIKSQGKRSTTKEKSSGKASDLDLKLKVMEEKMGN